MYVASCFSLVYETVYGVNKWFIYCSKLIRICLSVSSEISLHRYVYSPMSRSVVLTFISSNSFLCQTYCDFLSWNPPPKKNNKHQRTLEAVTYVLNDFNWLISHKSYWFGLQPHVNEVHLVFAVPLARVGGRVLWVRGAFWCHVHPSTTQNHLKRITESLYLQ